jgi:hypothetical protein
MHTDDKPQHFTVTKNENIQKKAYFIKLVTSFGTEYTVWSKVLKQKHRNGYNKKQSHILGQE